MVVLSFCFFSGEVTFSMQLISKIMMAALQKVFKKAPSVFKSDVRLCFIYFKFNSNLLSNAEGSAQLLNKFKLHWSKYL